jgi:hypothetical protein
VRRVGDGELPGHSERADGGSRLVEPFEDWIRAERGELETVRVLSAVEE